MQSTTDDNKSFGSFASCHVTYSCCYVTGPVALQKIIQAAVEMLEGLTQLHAGTVLHMDLKPGNILLDEYGHAYLSDFGISYALRTLEACTSVRSAAGTPHYM